ncbi:hypothetical protein GCM10007938_39750 [Vibrio zhanjiangensis]|uniref:RNA polymerase sigma factor 70 region 4 type 2 domain-containing protein n=1 Tax=Vibrio zhanjiangensis TaxID=1046128 RepID=A0ABQ6F4K7_9VIBR|nr:sigma factor-like helix-turn-helix DNA-binding protein [Vibrio zhanjiangensis]GLT20192.1 hypothetical protein GCM10007938_39750 [Vibrio zhanjiangensis]
MPDKRIVEHAQLIATITFPELPPKQAVALLLSLFYSREELCELMDIQSSTLRTHLSRGMKTIRQIRGNSGVDELKLVVFERLSQMV